jgi:hypothetical protein
VLARRRLSTAEGKLCSHGVEIPLAPKRRRERLTTKGCTAAARTALQSDDGTRLYMVLKRGSGVQGSMHSRKRVSAMVQRRIAAQELSLSGNGGRKEFRRPSIGSWGKSLQFAAGLNTKPVPFSGGRMATSFPLVEYLATTLLPLSAGTLSKLRFRQL